MSTEQQVRVVMSPGSNPTVSPGLLVAQFPGLRSWWGSWGATRTASEVQGSIWWATEEDAANPSVLPGEHPLDRCLPVASMISSLVSSKYNLITHIFKSIVQAYLIFVFLWMSRSNTAGEAVLAAAAAGGGGARGSWKTLFQDPGNGTSAAFQWLF